MERRNPNLLNHRETRKTEPATSDKKATEQVQAPLKVFRVSQVNAASSAVTNYTSSSKQQSLQSTGFMITSPPQGASGKGNEIRLPSKARRVVRISKKNTSFKSD